MSLSSSISLINFSCFIEKSLDNRQAGPKSVKSSGKVIQDQLGGKLTIQLKGY